MKKMLFKEMLRSVSRTKSRFISIIAIVALGISFFAGINAAAPDMEQTAIDYFKSGNLMDLWMISTVGFNQSDVDAVKEIDGVANAVGYKFADGTVEVDGKTCANMDGGQTICRAYGLDFTLAENYDKGIDNKDYINRITLLEGRYPTAENECLIDRSEIATPSDFKIGKKIKIVGIEENINNKLKVSEFEIVGVIRTPRYISFERGQTNVGSGSLGCFIYVPQNSFRIDYFTEICVRAENSDKFYPYSDEYYNYLKPVSERILSVSDEHIAVRIEEATAEYKKQLEDGKAEYEKKKKEADEKLGSAFSELEYYRNLVASGDAEIAKAEAKLNSSLSSAQSELDSGKKEYAAGLAEYNAKKKEYDDGKKQYNDYQKKYTELQSTVIEQNEKMSSLKTEIEDLQEQINNFSSDFEPVTDENGYIITGEDPDLTALKEQVSNKKKERQNIAAEYVANNMEIKQIADKLPEAKKALEDGKKQLDDAKKLLDENGIKISNGESEIASSQAAARAQIEAKKKELEAGRAKLAEYDNQYNEEYEKAYSQLDDAKYDIQQAEKELEAVATSSSWMIYDRTALPGYENYGQTAESMEAFASVFPVFFFIVSALVVLTTMTRMVDEERTQLGTLKALGYSEKDIRLKYILYSFFATVIGSVIGLSVGFVLYPNAIFSSYSVVYQLPKLTILFPVKYILLGTVFSVLTTVLATYFSSRREMNSNPAILMRAKAPKPGKRVLLERIPFIWNRFNFTSKVTTRNLFRNKKRFLMTFIGVTGCTALLVTGFGINDSIDAILKSQFGDGGVSMFDAQVALKNSQISATDSIIYNKVCENKNVDNAMMFYNRMVEGGSDKSEDTLDVNLFVPQNNEDLSKFIDLRERKTDIKHTLDNSGVIITEKFAKIAKVSPGDTINLKFNDGLTVKILVSAVVENYAYHYVYMSPELYTNVFRSPVSFNYMYITYADNAQANEIATDLMKYNDINAVVDANQVITTFDKLFDCLNLVIAVFIISAAALAFVVLYNLSNINVNERKREIATLKVLGFYNRESTSYVGRENIIITFFGVFAGLLAGVYLHQFVISMAEVNVVMFGREIGIMSFVYSVLMTFAFSFFVNFAMHFYIKKIDMVESLKSID